MNALGMYFRINFALNQCVRLHITYLGAGLVAVPDALGRVMVQVVELLQIVVE